jgi:hypothetical protein
VTLISTTTVPSFQHQAGQAVAFAPVAVPAGCTRIDAAAQMAQADINDAALTLTGTIEGSDTGSSGPWRFLASFDWRGGPVKPGQVAGNPPRFGYSSVDGAGNPLHMPAHIRGSYSLSKRVTVGWSVDWRAGD